MELPTEVGHVEEGQNKLLARAHTRGCCGRGVITMLLGEACELRARRLGRPYLLVARRDQLEGRYVIARELASRVER